MADLSDDELLDALGIEVKIETKAAHTPLEERMIAGFEDIQRFVQSNGRKPQHGEERAAAQQVALTCEVVDVIRICFYALRQFACSSKAAGKDGSRKTSLIVAETASYGSYPTSEVKSLQLLTKTKITLAFYQFESVMPAMLHVL